jgi:hypothetical protein
MRVSLFLKFVAFGQDLIYNNICGKGERAVFPAGMRETGQLSRDASKGEDPCVYWF